MSTHNICFCGEIRKILYGYPLMSGAMLMWNLKILWVDSVDCRCTMQAGPDLFRLHLS